MNIKFVQWVYKATSWNIIGGTTLRQACKQDLTTADLPFLLAFVSTRLFRIFEMKIVVQRCWSSRKKGVIRQKCRTLITRHQLSNRLQALHHYGLHWVVKLSYELTVKYWFSKGLFIWSRVAGTGCVHPIKPGNSPRRDSVFIWRKF